MSDTGLSLKNRILSELTGFDGNIYMYADDLNGTRIEIGADTICESASTIKIFVLGTLFEEALAGRADLNAPLSYRTQHYVDGSGVIRYLKEGLVLRAEDAAVLMIIYSDNIATNMLIEYLGIERINAFIKKTGCSSSRLHRRLYSEGGHGKLGDITPRDMGRFFTLLSEGKLVSPEASHKMKDIFRKQQLKEMLSGQLPAFYFDPDREASQEDLFYVASKSGSMDDCRNDGGIIHTPCGEYILVMMCTDFSNKLEVLDHPAFLYGQRVSRLIFDQYMALNGRFK